MALAPDVAARFDAIEAQMKVVLDGIVERQKEVDAMAAKFWPWVAAARSARGSS